MSHEQGVIAELTEREPAGLVGVSFGKLDSFSRISPRLSRDLAVAAVVANLLHAEPNGRMNAWRRIPSLNS